MKVQILSDIHNEFINKTSGTALSGETQYRHWTAQIPKTDAKLIILAGDIDIGVKGIEWAIKESIRLNTPVIYVAGNHEYYNREYYSNLKNMREVSSGTNVHFLECNEVVIDGVRILGLTLWTDYGLVKGLSPNDAMQECLHSISDHRLIRFSSDEFFTPEHARSIHATSVKWLEDKLDELTDCAKTIVISHHGPSKYCQHKKYPVSAISTAFQSDLDDLLGKADVWIYGHTHSNLDTTINGCRLISNQPGYPSEDVSNFYSNKVIEI